MCKKKVTHCVKRRLSSQMPLTNEINGRTILASWKGHQNLPCSRLKVLWYISVQGINLHYQQKGQGDEIQLKAKRKYTRGHSSRQQPISFLPKLQKEERVERFTVQSARETTSYHMGCHDMHALRNDNQRKRRRKRKRNCILILYDITFHPIMTILELNRDQWVFSATFYLFLRIITMKILYIYLFLIFESYIIQNISFIHINLVLQHV